MSQPGGTIHVFWMKEVNILQCPGQLPLQRMVQPKVSVRRLSAPAWEGAMGGPPGAGRGKAGPGGIRALSVTPGNWRGPRVRCWVRHFKVDKGFACPC